MMYIKRLLDQTASIAELNQIAQKAEAKISFWGARYVSFTNSQYEGTLHIDAMAARVIQLAKERGFAFTTEEREIGRLLEKRILQIYKDNDGIIYKINCLTLLFIKIRAGFSIFFQKGVLGWNTLENSYMFPWQKTFYSYVRWIWMEKGFNRQEDSYHRMFDYYTEEQYKKEFDSPPKKFTLFQYPDHEYRRVGPLLYKYIKPDDSITVAPVVLSQPEPVWQLSAGWQSRRVPIDQINFAALVRCNTIPIGDPKNWISQPLSMETGNEQDTTNTRKKVTLEALREDKI